MKRYVIGRWKEVMTVIHKSNKLKTKGYDYYTVEEVTEEFIKENKQLFDRNESLYDDVAPPTECYYKNMIHSKYIKHKGYKPTLPPNTLYLLTLYKENTNDQNSTKS